MSERTERDEGETLVEVLPKSSLHQFNQKLTLVAAGHEFSGWQVPRALTRATYFYIDPHRLLADPRLRFAEIELRPRLFFSEHRHICGSQANALTPSLSFRAQP